MAAVTQNPTKDIDGMLGVKFFNVTSANNSDTLDTKFGNIRNIIGVATNGTGLSWTKSGRTITLVNGGVLTWHIIVAGE